MKLTPFGLLDVAQGFLANAAAPVLADDEELIFQRFLNLPEQQGSLEISLRKKDNVRTVGLLHARLMDGGHEPCLQGWFQPEGNGDRRSLFVLTDPEASSSDKDIRVLSEGWVASMSLGRK